MLHRRMNARSYLVRLSLLTELHAHKGIAMDRRQLLQLGAAAGMGTALAGCGSNPYLDDK